MKSKDKDARNAGAAIVNLDDYKSGKSEGAGKEAAKGQTVRNSNRSVSEARNPNTNKPIDDVIAQEPSLKNKIATSGVKTPDDICVDFSTKVLYQHL